MAYKVNIFLNQLCFDSNAITRLPPPHTQTFAQVLCKHTVSALLNISIWARVTHGWPPFFPGQPIHFPYVVYISSAISFDAALSSPQMMQSPA